MNCFKHNDESAVGVCKVCCKAVCRKCFIETPSGLVCSEACAVEAQSIQEVIEYNKNRLQKIENSPWHGNILLLGSTFLAIFMWTSPIVKYLKYSSVNYNNVVYATTFSLIPIAIYLFYKNKKRK